MEQSNQNCFPVDNPERGQCHWCGETGFPKGSRNPRRYCCDWCRDSMHIYRSSGRVRTEKRVTKVEVPTHCKGCGAELDQSGCRNPRVWCSEACRVRYYREHKPGYKEHVAKLAHERAVAAELAKPPRPRCANCGAEMARRAASKFCSKPDCRAMSAREYRARQPECSVDGCAKKVIAFGLCGPHYSTQWRKNNPDKASVTRSRYRARKRGAFVEDVDSFTVFERDKWTCGICGERIPKSAKWPDVKSASVDHVVPLNCGGKHEMKNVQAAHLGCNSAKSDKGAGDQLALI